VSYLHLRKEIPLNANVEVRIVLINVVLEVSVRKFVASLILTVVLSVLLNGVVSKMDHPVGQVLQSKFSAACSQVAICIEIALNVTVNRAHEGVQTNVEFPLVY
jgi:hypothetical protein